MRSSPRLCTPILFGLGLYHFPVTAKSQECSVDRSHSELRKRKKDAQAEKKAVWLGQVVQVGKELTVYHHKKKIVIKIQKGTQQSLLFFNFCFLQPYCPSGISPMGNLGCLPQGKPAATKSRYPTYCACWVFYCFHNPLNSDMDYRIFNMHTDVNACDCTWGCMDTRKRVCTES